MSLKRYTEKAVRSTIHAQRIAEELRKALTGTETEGDPPTCLLVMCNGYFATAAGEGTLFRRYCSHKNIHRCIYSGRNVKPKFPNEDDYKKSRLRILPFDYAFDHVKHDVHKRELIY